MTHFKAPTNEQVKVAVRRIPKPQLRRAFFEGLKNPLWITPLAKEGVFNNPPEPEKTEDGYIRDIYWPEIDYLTRIAPDASEAVVDVLLKLSETNNAWVRRGVFEIGAAIPAEEAARLQPLIKSWQSTGFGWRTDPKSLVAYAVNLLEGGQDEVGRWFADLIFRPSKTKRGKPKLVLDDYWYEQGLPAVTKALGPENLDLVLSWLVAYERKRRHLTAKSDITYISRDSIRQTTDTLDKVEHALIDAVRDLAIEAMLSDADTAKNLLLGSNMLLARKIALHSLSQALERVQDGDERRGQLLAIASDLLSDNESGEDACRIDYAELARAVARSTGEPIQSLIPFLELGPRVDGERLRDWLRTDDDDEGDVDERVEEFTNRWKHRWLSAIGLDALPAQLRTELESLDSMFGVIEDPLEPTAHVTTWVGPNSAVSQDEMAAMSPTELVAHLESWHDTGSGWGPEPSHEGQGRELTALLTTNPKALAGVNGLVDRLRPTYLRAILRGWEAALKAELEPDWVQVSDLIDGVLGHADESSFPPEGGSFDDDADFRPAKQAAVALLVNLVKKRASPDVPGDAMSRFAELLIDAADDDAAWSEYDGFEGDSGMDPLTTSLNWQWPVRIRGLIHLMSHGSSASWYEAARSALEKELSREDVRGTSRAVVGEGLARLLAADPEWLMAKIPELFGSEAGLSVDQQIAVTTAMAVHRYHPQLYELLAPSMVAAIQSDEPIAAGWSTHSDPLQRIGEWVIDAIIRGHKAIDDPVAHEFFTVASANSRGEAIGHVAWSFMHADTVDDEIRDRFAELWDQRVAHVRACPEDHDELNGFHWFVKSGKFAAEWWLPRLREAAELDPNLSTERYMIGNELAMAADVDPRNALDALKLLLEGKDEAGMVAYDLTRNAVPMVIARAIAWGDHELEQDAVALMNELGERGNLSLEADVKKVLEGAIDQSDLDE